jgi:thimet oligopeptidase
VTAVTKGLLDVTASMYELEYKPVVANAWHADVSAYEVYSGGKRIGKFYLDLYPRADKFKHAAMFPIRSGKRLPAIGSGQPGDYQLPMAVLECNFPKPTGAPDSPALMEHGDVVTFFHEFGHVLHHILTKSELASYSGANTVQDFVEAPSQMFEEWAWRYETLKRFAKSPDGTTIPEALVDKMQRARKFGLGTQTVQQMLYAAVSLGFHQADPAKLDQTKMVKELQAKYTPFPYVEGTKFHTSFGHLNGYSSMYYTYMWSLVIAKDMLTPFAKAGLMSTEVARKYRDAILVPGGNKDAAELVKDFLGRPYDFKAFEKYLSE